MVSSLHPFVPEAELPAWKATFKRVVANAKAEVQRQAV